MKTNKKKAAPKRQMVWVSGMQGYIVPKRTKRGDKLVAKIVDEVVASLLRPYAKRPQ